MGDEWRARSEELVAVLRDGRAPAQQVVELLELINGADYPVAGLTSVDAESVLCSVLGCAGGHSAESIPQLALLVSTLLAQQQLSLLPSTQHALLSLFLNWLSRARPPTELLYACAALTQAGADPQDSEALLSTGSALLRLAFGGHCPTTTQRAALHYVTTLCSRCDLPQVLLHSLLDSLLQQLLSPSLSPTDSVLQAKLVLSLLRLAHAVLLHLNSLRAYPSLATLLAALKANMAAGLPGQLRVLASIQPPLSVPPFLLSPRSLSVAGPHQHRRHRGRGRERGRTGEQHSDPAPPPPTLPSRHTNPPSYSSSESELSDSEPAPSQMKAVNGKIRHQAYSCLATIFQALDRHTTFSYWLSFLPDGPRPPNSAPSLLTCILKDPTPKCRGAAVAVLSAMLEGSKPYLAAADDKPLPSQPFTPYSSTLGAVLKELHRSLTLATATESHPTTLTRTIKCLSLLVANTPYHQLSEGYLTRVVSTLHPCTAHRDTDVHVACLTCYGAMMSTSPPLPEVQQWLGEREGGPWLVEHCVTLVKGGAPLALKTEALQVLAAVPKFYFQAIRLHWSQLGDLYLYHLVQVPDPLQQHALKMLEELCRALPPCPEVAQLWETLLLAGGPLTTHLQHPTTCGPTCAQACNVLATIGNATLEQLKVPAQRLALSLPLSLSQDETANATVTASAVRVLGVFVLYDSLREDASFLLDCRASFLHSLHSPSLPIRTQASWALGNLTDVLPALPLPLLLPLYASICQAMEDNEKVKCNAVRAAGNLLKALQEPVVSSCSKELEKLAIQLAKCVNSGTMKSRWNACYAAHSALSNTVFTTHCSTSSKDLLSVLCVAVQTCKNFKVRSNAALALGSPAHYCGREQFLAVWEAVIQALGNSDQQIGDFSEYKHAATLKTQLCSTVCHMCAVMTVEQAQALSPLSLPQTITRNIAEFLQLSQKEEDQTREAADVVECALRTLRSLTSTTAGEGKEVVHQLLSMLQDSSPS